MGSMLATAAAFVPVDQHYLLQARQMQALSFAVHIPLVAFGISFPVMVLFVEWLYVRTRRPRVPDARAALDAGDGGAVRGRGDHRHHPELRDGAAVAELHRHVRQRVRPRVRDRGLLVLHGGDLHRDLRLRLGPPVAPRAPAQRDPDRDHRLHRLADGDRGQRLDEPSRRVSPASAGRSSTSTRSRRCSATATCGTS